MDCNGNIYNIGMGCCEPMLGPIENYYTKPATDRRIQEEISGISAVTIDEVQEMIDEAVSGITVSGVTEEQMNEAIASAKTQIEAEIPIVPTKVSAFENDVPYLTEHQSLSGYATEQWVEDKHYITGVDLSDYSTTEQMNNAITAATDGLATTAYVNTQISAETGDFIDGEELSSYTYDKATIDSKIGSGGTGITSGEVQTMIDSSISGKTDNSSFTAHTSDTTVHVTSTEKATWNAKSDFSGDYNDLTNKLSAGTNITIIDNVISAQGGGKAIEAGRGISVTTGATADTISFSLSISAGTGSNSIAEGANTSATGNYAHAEGEGTVASNLGAHAEGRSAKASGVDSHAEGNSTIASGNKSHAEGDGSKANGSYSHSEGKYTITNNDSEHASGQYNVSNIENYNFGGSGNTLFSVGNGTSSSARHNAFEIRQNADIYVTSGGTDILLQDNLASSTEKTTWNQKQDGLTAGTGVNISGNVISMKIWSGTKAQFDAITVKDNETIYLVTD